jgi:S-DNA-T family DNA segregation ATPase FtsK/SpoIIIE
MATASRPDRGADELEPTTRHPRRKRSSRRAQDSNATESAAAQVVSQAGERTLVRELTAITLLALGVFLIGALALERSVGDGSCVASSGPFGPVGGCVRWTLVSLLGWAGAAVVPVIPLAHSLRLFGKLNARNDRSWLVFTSGLAIILPVAWGLARGVEPSTGLLDRFAGLWGGLASYYLARAVGTGGAWCAVLLAFSALAAVSLGWNPVRAMLGLRVRRRATSMLTSAETLAPDPADLPKLNMSLAAEAALGTDESRAARELDDAHDLDADDVEMEDADAGDGGQPALNGRDATSAASADAASTRARRARGRKGAIDAEAQTRLALRDALADAAAADPADHELPPLTLLDRSPATDVEESRKTLEENGQRLVDTLRTFRVESELVGWTRGPTVTQYEIAPAPGVKVRQIANLANDIALAMRAQSIRVVAPIPGKGAVGVELPNATREMVALRDLLESREYQATPRALPIALGRDLQGKPVVADLARMPHLLIAGATGSGKSVTVNTIITSLIYRHTPETLRFLMVDPKMVELSVYNSLPHLRHKVVTDNRDAAFVLKWAVHQMQERYQLLAENGARNIQDFNVKVRNGVPLRTAKNKDVAFEVRTYAGGVLPYIVVVIDELADLMMTVQGEVETPLAMLAQKARAIGIHLLLATQRPSVNVITGLIKANFPSRIAFRVASQVDSRTIIDGIGAESLLGNGDMLFIPPGQSDLHRLQGAFLSNDETERVLEWYVERRQSRTPAHAQFEAAHEPDILEEIRALEASERGDGNGADDVTGGDRDALFREAAEVCIQHQNGSTSLLQRRLKIGYGRAARIIDQLHDAGILGPPDGSRPRDVLKGLHEID